MKTKKKKCEEAELRQVEYDALSKDKKLKRVKGRRGNSIKEKKRIRGKE